MESFLYSCENIGQYQILSPLGEGSSGKVLLGAHAETGQKYALKVIDKNLSGSAFLETEIAFMKALNHENVLKLYEVIEIEEINAICLVTEYMEGNDLCDYLCKNGCFSEMVTRKMMRQIVAALQHCHANNVIHRDLKADNVLFDSKNRIKLADFGLATFQPPGQLLNTFVGSQPYCSPEVLMRRKYSGEKADVFSLGVVLYSLLTATFPWAGVNEQQKFLSNLRGEWLMAPEISPLCADLLGKMLEAEPTRRISIDEIATHPWLQGKKSQRNSSQPEMRQKEKPEQVVSTLSLKPIVSRKKMTATQRMRSNITTLFTKLCRHRKAPSVTTAAPAAC